jgi:hypothetical protein
MLEEQQMHFGFMDVISLHNGHCTNCTIAHQSVTYLHQLPFHVSQHFHLLNHNSPQIYSLYFTPQNHTQKNSFNFFHLILDILLFNREF